MARLMRDSKIDTRSARLKLKHQHEPYWRDLGRGLALGYYRPAGDVPGTWIVRYRVDGRYIKTRIGSADDYQDADEALILDFKQAQEAAFKKSGVEHKPSKYTLREAIDDYIENVRAKKGQAAADLVPGRLTNHLDEDLLNMPVEKLKTGAIKTWLNGQIRTEAALQEAGFTDPAVIADKIRASRDTANRRLAVLKACLNGAFNDGKVKSDTEWRRVKRFENTSAARKLFLTEKQVAALLAKAKGGVRNVIKAGVLTGARRGELFALRVRDFDAKGGTLQVAQGKTGARTVYLSDESVAFFKELAKNKLPEVHLLTKDDGTPWPEDDLNRPFKAATRAAKLPQETTFYSLRHYHISRALLAGVQPQVVAENCGTSLRMIEKHYGKFLATDRRAMFNAVAL